MSVKKLIILILLTVSLGFGKQNSKQISAALALFSEGKYLECAQFLSAINPDELKTNEDKAAYYYYAGKSFIQINKVNAAIFSLEYLINNFKNSSLREYAIYDLGKFYFELKDFEDALITFEILINEYSYGKFYGSSLFWAGQSAAKLDYFEDAKDYYQDAISMSATNDYLIESIYSLAKLYEKNKNYDDAISYYDELLSYYSSSKFAPYAQLRIGKSYFHLGEYDNAILELKEPSIKKLPQKMQLEARYYIANSYFRMKEYDKALDIYHDLLKTFPGEEESNQIRFNEAWINFQSGMYEEAYRIFNLLSKLADGKIAEESLFWAAESKRYNGEDELAELIYKHFIKLYPQSNFVANVKFNLAVIEFERGNIKKAKSYLLAAITGDDKEAKAKSYLLLAQIFMTEKNYQLARDNYEKASEELDVSKKTHFGGMLGLGVADFYLNDLSSARKQLTDLFTVDKNFEKDRVNFYLAETHFAIGDYHSALEHYKYVDEKNPDVGAQTVFGKAYCYFNLKNYSDAAFYFNEFVNRYPNSELKVEALLRLGDCYYGTKNFVNALDIYDKVFNSSMSKKADGFSYYQYGKTLLKVKQFNKGITILKQLQKKFPSSKYADDGQYLIGWSYFKKRFYNKAITEYKRALKIYPKTNLRPVIYYSIGDAYYNQRNYNMAVKFYKRLLDNYSNTDFIFDAINGIQFSYVALGHPENASKIIDEYIVRNPYSKYGDKILIKKGEIFYNAYMYQKAKIAFKEFIATYPNSTLVPSAYYWIGKSALKLDQTADAEFNLQRVVTDYPNSESGIAAAVDLAKMYIEKKQYVKAVEMLNAVLSKAEKTDKLAELLYYKGLALIEQNKIKDVYDNYNKLIAEYPETIFADKAKIELGVLELARNSYKTAEDVFSDIGKRRKDDVGAKAQYLYGETLLAEGKYYQAISAFVRVKTVFGSFYDWATKAELKIGDVYVKMNNKKKAKKIYSEIYRKHRRDIYGKEAKTKLRRLR